MPAAPSTVVAPLPKVVLGQGGYGKVMGPTQELIRDQITRTLGIRRKRIQVEKTYHETKSMKDAMKYQKTVNKIDPSRVYLRGKILSNDTKKGKATMTHEGKSLDKVPRTAENRRLFFESFYQLLQALVLLQDSGYVHHDIKTPNITMDTRTTWGGEPVATLGLIDFDLLAKKGAHEVTHSKHAYFVYPLETFYDPVNDRFTVFDEKRQPHPDPVAARLHLANKYLPHLAFLRRDERGLEAMRNLFRHTQDPAKHPFPSTAGVDPLVLFYLQNLYTKSQRKEYMKRDGNKVDTFSLGQVLYIMLRKYENALFADHPKKDELVVLLKSFIISMVHPIPSFRYDAKSALVAWMNILSLYNPSIHRKVSRQVHLPLPEASLRFMMEPSSIPRRSDSGSESVEDDDENHSPSSPLPLKKRKRGDEKEVKKRSPPPPPVKKEEKQQKEKKSKSSV